MKLDQVTARRANRSAASSPYTRTTQKKANAESTYLSSSGSFSSLFSFLTAPFRSSKKGSDKEPVSRPSFSDRDSEAEVSRIVLPLDGRDGPSGYESNDEPMADFQSSASLNPAQRLAMRGQELNKQSQQTPIFSHQIIQAPKGDPPPTNRYIPRQPPLPPVFMDPRSSSNQPLSYPSAHSPSPIHSQGTPTTQMQASNSMDRLMALQTIINNKIQRNESFTDLEAKGLEAFVREQGVFPLAATPSVIFSSSLGVPSTPTPFRASHSERSLPTADMQSEMTPSSTQPSLTSRSPDSMKNPNPSLLYRGAGRSAHIAPRGSNSRPNGRNVSQGRPLPPVPAAPEPVLDSKRRKLDDGSAAKAKSSANAPAEANSTSTNLNGNSSSNLNVSGPNSRFGAPNPALNEELAIPARGKLFGVGLANPGANLPTKPSPLRQSTRPDSPNSSPGSANSSAKNSPLIQRDAPKSSPLARKVPGLGPNESTSSNSTATHGLPAKSRTFDLFAEVIANHTPKKIEAVTDVTNPYEQASPFRAARKPVRRKPAQAAPAKPVPASTKERPQEPPVQKKVMTALELIEMTAPKNLKRSSPMETTASKAVRPRSPSPPRIPTPSPQPTPAPSFVRTSFAPSPSVSLAQAARRNGFPLVPVKDAADEMDASEDIPVAKTRPKVNGHGPNLLARVGPPVASSSKAPLVDEVIDLVDDEDEEDGEEEDDEDGAEEEVVEMSASQTAITSSQNTKNKTQLRNPYRAKEPSPLRQSFAPPKSEGNTSPEGTPAGSPRARATLLENIKLPSFSFATVAQAVADPSGINAASLQGAKYKAANSSPSSLPTFSFGKAAIQAPPTTTSLSAPLFGTVPSKPAAASASIVGSMASGGFNWAAAGMKPPSSSATVWKCSTCMLDNPVDKSKCTVCDSARPDNGSSSTPQTASFNWAAAGIAPPASSSSKWNCPTCMVDNDINLPKCIACTEDRPASVAPVPAPAASSTPAPVVGFNFAAAGFKLPSVAAGQWTCTVCGLNSPDSATKCTVCDAPK
ncbi:hypothetical protein BKA62DRAFT_713782 [Auriculariales sp. MPI-PUGE-AT-0066]|nr:hypothetical protein BKA62DRAFT_713782 [Auriculariales sp. MPI-PUGE-AT-0066]